MLKRSFLFHLFLVICVIAGLLFLFFNSLDWLTNHGKETMVPKLVGKNMRDGIKILEKQGFKIDIDSAYMPYMKPLEIVFQEPESGARVKVGRTIFITVNRKTAPSIEMPNLVNLSFRNAMLVMQSYRLVMGDTIYRPDVAAGSILEQWYNGKPIAAGTHIPEGSRITLVVGEGLYGEQEVPNVIGMTWMEARNLITSLEFTFNVMWEGPITDSNYAIVFMQSPEALNELDFVNKMPKGDLLDVRVMQNPSPELLARNQPGSKKLLGEVNLNNDSLVRAINSANSAYNDSVSKNYKPDNNKPSKKSSDKKPDNKNDGPVKKSDDPTKDEYN